MPSVAPSVPLAALFGGPSPWAPVFDFRPHSCHSPHVQMALSASDFGPMPRKAKSDFLSGRRRSRGCDFRQRTRGREGLRGHGVHLDDAAGRAGQRHAAGASLAPQARQDGQCDGRSSRYDRRARAGQFDAGAARKGLAREQTTAHCVKLGRPSTPARPRPSETADHRGQIDRVRRDALFANCAPLQLARLLGQLEPVALASCCSWRAPYDVMAPGQSGLAGGLYPGRAAAHRPVQQEGFSAKDRLADDLLPAQPGRSDSIDQLSGA